jgi:hypothetical protein
VDFLLGGLNYQIEHHLFPACAGPTYGTPRPSRASSALSTPSATPTAARCVPVARSRGTSTRSVHRHAIGGTDNRPPRARRGQAIAMTGQRNSANRLAQVRMWVAEHAASLGLPVSVPLLCEAAVGHLGVRGATLTVDTPHGWPETSYATDTLGGTVAELQLTVGEGPSMAARCSGGPVLAADLDSPDAQKRWPLFASLAVDAGARALFALPLCVGTIQVGILALHRDEPGPLPPATLTDSLAFAKFALVLLLDAQAEARDGPADPADRLPLHNPQLHQATGMIAGQLDVGMNDAFTRLRAKAFADQRPLAELAADVVARRLRFGPTQEMT